MRALGFGCALTLFGGLAPNSAGAWPDDPCAQSDARGRSHCARTLYAQREYGAAARHYERLWLETNDLKYLYNAAAAREAAGHDAAALALWTRYAIDSPVEPAERDELTLRLQSMRARLTAVAVTVTPAEVIGPAAIFWCERVGANSTEAFDIPARLVAEAAAGNFTLHLSPGAWTVRLSPASAISTYGPVQAPVEVTPYPGQLDMVLTDGHPRDLRQHDLLRLRLGLGGTAGGLALIGVLVLALGPGRPAVEASDTSIPKREARFWLRGIGGGAGLLGGAVGLGVAAGLETLPPTRRRYYIQLGAGAGVFLVGLVVHARMVTKFNQASGVELREGAADKQPFGRGVSAAMLGAGLSLMAGVGASYLVRVWLPQRRQDLSLGGLWRPHTIGLAVHGRF